ncbi:MAG: hypothetical protein KAR18_07020 [Spirochaetes bacterium]|nr:hypothetical protein [Spirochaetota bacterium]
MTLKQIKDILNAEEIFNWDLSDYEINKVCGCDLMSDVLSLNEISTLLLTGLINPQVIRTVEMADIPAVCFIRGKRPREETVKLAEEKKIPLLCTRYPMFEACGRLYAEGLRGCVKIQ